MSKRGKAKHANIKCRKPDVMAELAGGAVLVGTAAILISSPADVAQAATVHSDQASTSGTTAPSLAGQSSPQSAWGYQACGPVGPQGPQGGSGQGGSFNWGCSAGNQGPQGFSNYASMGTKGLPPCTQIPQGITGAQGPNGQPVSNVYCPPEPRHGPTGPTGPQGPQSKTGPQGPRGKTGPQGPRGKTGSFGPTIVVTRTYRLGTFGGRTVYAPCPPFGRIATGGGYAFSGGTTGASRILYSDRPFAPFGSPIGWEISFKDSLANAHQTVTVYAACSR
jgi:hypothetical protein